jgi:hypothetical protein
VPAGTYKVSVTKVHVNTSGPPPSAQMDPTKAYQEHMKANNMKMGSRGTMEQVKPKSEIPERYSKPGSIPDQVVPASGTITIELKSK